MRPLAGSGPALALALGCVFACGAAASPLSSLSLSTGLDAPRGGAAAGSWWGPGIELAGPGAALALDARMRPPAFRHRPAAGRLRFAATFRDRGPLAPELVLGAFHRSGAVPETGVRSSLRYHLAGLRGGTWISASADGVLGGPAGDALRMPLIGIGAWTRGHGITLSAGLEQDVGTLAEVSPSRPPDTSRVVAPLDGTLRAGSLTHAERRIMVTSAYSTLRWAGERVEVESAAGVTVGKLTAPRRWAQASVAYRVLPTVAVVASAGSPAPRAFAIDPAGERRAAVALRFSQLEGAIASPTLIARAEVQDCALRPLGEGRYRVTVRARGARRVEIQGDMTQWQPVVLAWSGADRWEGTLEMASGVHHLSLRVDGGPWGPPPRFPTAPDGFSGSVGIVVIE